MNILVVSYTFAPRIGGIERVCEVINEGLAANHHQIQVITHNLNPIKTAYPIWSRPSLKQMLKLGRWADVILFHNMSLNYGFLSKLTRRPVVCVSHGDYGFVGGGLRGAMLRWHLRRARNIAVSRYVANRIPGGAVVIHNPVSPSSNIDSKGGPRVKDILFVGRLVRGKGVHVLLEAVSQWPSEKIPSVTIVGDGREQDSLAALAQSLQLSNVTFLGALSFQDVQTQMSCHKLLAVPSIDTEGLGLVALEGIASGCVPVVSDIGGLSEAIGPCGVLLPSGDVSAWAASLHELLSDPARQEAYRSNSSSFLEAFRLEDVLSQYETVLTSAVAAKAAKRPGT